jgi:hypothetical protein
VDIPDVIRWIFPVLGGVILYFPVFLVKPSERLSGRELANTRPSTGWVRWVFPAMAIGWGLLLLFLTFVVPISSAKDMSKYTGVLLGGVLLGGMAAFNGFFALCTGVCPLPTPVRFFYTVRKDLTRRIGLIQVGFGSLMIAASCFIPHFQLL